MWLWSSICLILLLSSSSVTFGVSTSQGSTSEKESEILWKNGNEAIQDGRFQDAVNAFQRILNRYPGNTGYLEAQFFLGRSQLELGRAEESLRTLKDFLTTQSSRSTRTTLHARVLIGRAYLELKKFNEAYLVALEIDRLNKSDKIPIDLLVESLLIKSEALMRLHHLDRAVSAAESSEKLLEKTNHPELLGQTFALQLSLKSLACASLPTSEYLNENQIRAQIDRRGTCLLEALLLLKKTLKTGDMRSSEQSVTRMSQEFESYFKFCAHPRQRIKSSREGTIEQRAQSQRELAFLLSQECKTKIENALDLVKTWKTELPSVSIKSTLKISSELEKIIPRNL